MTTWHLSSENTQALPSPDFCFLLHKIRCALTAFVTLTVHGSFYFVSAILSVSSAGIAISQHKHDFVQGELTNKMEDNMVASTRWVPHKVSS